MVDITTETTTATAVQPTSGHTWVLRTESDDGHESQTSSLAARPGHILLDYLRVTLPDTPETWAGLGAWLGEVTDRPIGWRGWYSHSAYVLDGGLLGWCEDPDMAERQGVLVDLPGKACACLGDDLVPFLRWCVDADGHVARADFALDDFEGRLTRERILEAEAVGGMVTRWRGGIHKYETVERGKVKDWTFYIGSRDSESFMRIYDKAAEQRKKRGGRAGTPAAPAGTPAVWVRCELECKGKFAHALAEEVLARGGEAVTEQIARRIRFAEASETDTNRRRWLTADWWADFLGSVVPGAALVAGEAVRATIEAMCGWVEHAAGSTIATILDAYGAGGDWVLQSIIARCKDRPRNSRQKHALKRYRALALAGG